MSVIVPSSGRRVFSPEVKWNIVQQAKTKSQSISVLARQYDVNTNQVFRWVREADAGKVLWVRRVKASMKHSGDEVHTEEHKVFLPVSVSSPAVAASSSVPEVNAKGVTVEFRSGHRLVIADVTPTLLQHLVAALV